VATLRGLLFVALGRLLPLAAPQEWPVSEFAQQAFSFSVAGVSSCNPICHVARPTKKRATAGLPAGVSGPCFVQIHSRSTSSNVVPVFITILTV